MLCEGPAATLVALAMQGSQPFPVPTDALGHNGVADGIAANLRALPDGSVVAIHGPWGQGKTDLLRRVFNRVIKSTEVMASWVNPWQYGHADLITPVLMDLMARDAYRHSLTDQRGFAPLAKRIVKAALVAASAATGVTRDHFDVAERGTKFLMRQLFPELAKKGGLDEIEVEPDPTFLAGEALRDLIKRAFPLHDVMVFVDDLDRCLPHRQVALLEAMHFLTAAGARARFVVAMDPVLVRQAVITHYGTDEFDPHRYLDKIFNLRVSLHRLAAPDVERLVSTHLDQMPDDVRKCLAAMLGDHSSTLLKISCATFSTVALRNPRGITRAFTRLELLARSTSGKAVAALLGDSMHVRLLLQWLVLCEWWPELRALCQDAGEWFAQRVQHAWLLIRDMNLASNAQPGSELAQAIEAATPDVRTGLSSPPPNYDIPHLISDWAAGTKGNQKIQSLARVGAFLAKLDAALVQAGL